MQRIPSLRTTLSHVSPDKAAQIRSAVTGALQHAQNGLCCFERTVETTFVLPWDLNPKVQPEKLSQTVRDGIRNQLLDSTSLHYLETCGAINWNPSVLWQCRLSGAGEGNWEAVEEVIAKHLEEGYTIGQSQLSFSVGFTVFQVDYDASKLLNTSINSLFEIRRVAFAPLMPMETEKDANSLFHAASLGFWGVHDRTSLLFQAVFHTLSDPKAQFLIYDRWSDEMARSMPAGSKPEFPQWEKAKTSLTEAPQLHLFTLANIVQRPIIVYSHHDSPVGGLYLPLLWEGANGQFLCEEHPHLRNPLALGYDAARNHFTPLVTFKGSKGCDPVLFPLNHANGSFLRLHFLSDAQQTQASADPASFLSKLLLMDVVPPSSQGMGGSYSGMAMSSASTSPTLAAVSMAAEMPEVMDTLVKRYESLFL